MREGYTRAFRWGGQEKPLWAKIQFLSRYPSEKTDPALVRAEGRERQATAGGPGWGPALHVGRWGDTRGLWFAL